jgi:TolA-binding protein
MKQFIALMMLVAVLSSCGEAVAPTPADTPTQETEINTEIDAATDATTDTIDAELEELDKTESVETNETSTEEDLEALESSVENIQVVYSNPKQEVTADIEYSLDSEGKITSINITDSNYDITKHISD